MSERDAKSIGYCGLACGVCTHACNPDCRGGGGEKGCHHRDCCVEKGLEGCWECAEFPCENGFFASTGDTAFRGVNIGSVLCIQQCGKEEYLRRVVARFGKTVDYGDYRFLDPEDVRKKLCGE